MDQNKVESPHCDDSDNKINDGAITETPFNKNQINVDESNNEINNIQKPLWFNKLINITKLKYFIILLLTIVLLIFILIITLMGLYIKNLKKEINKFITKKMIISIQDINTIEKEDNLKIIIGIYFGSSISGYYIVQNNNISSKISSLFPSDLILDKDSKRGLFYGDKAFEIDKNQYIF